MELFSEIYGCYYKVVAQILNMAHKQGISVADINKIVDREAFAESGLHLIPKLIGGDWELLKQNEDTGFWHSRLNHSFTGNPLTKIQKSWLKAILQDARIRLFLDDVQLSNLSGWLSDTEPLFSHSDIHIFDVALDGDDYNDENYIRNFRAILAAIKEQKTLMVEYKSARGRNNEINIIPVKLQYSEKDDKFRILGGTIHKNEKVSPLMLNMNRIQNVHSSRREVPDWIDINSLPEKGERIDEVVIRISKERNALERCMMQFAFYEKETQACENGRDYICNIRYRREEETELLIRILSFGPVIKVLGPESFVNQVRERLKKQLGDEKGNFR